MPAATLSNVLAMGPPSWRVGSNIKHGPARQVPRGRRRPAARLPGWRPGGSDESQALLEVRLDGVGDDAPLVRVDEGGGDPRPIGIDAALSQLLDGAGEPLIVAARLELPCGHVALQLLQLLQEPLEDRKSVV